jgi:uroporphyrinogen-III decarboxylase
MFADIMTPVAAMGVDVKLVEGVGPVVESFDARRLRIPTRSRRRCARRSASCARARRRQGGRRLLRAPFTVAGYLIEGSRAATS